MKKNVSGKKLGRDSAHRKALLRNLSISLIEHGEIKTTISKAKYFRPFVEKLVTKAKKGNLKIVKSRLSNEKATRKLMGEIAKMFKNYNGGYTRIVRLGRRDGDNTMMARVEWVVDKEKKKEPKKEPKKETKKKETNTGDVQKKETKKTKEDDLSVGEKEDTEEDLEDGIKDNKGSKDNKEVKKEQAKNDN